MNSLGALQAVERRVREALADPRRAQAQLLQGILERNSSTTFGRAHRFSGIRSLPEFRARVSLSEYEDYLPYLDAIRGGSTAVLTAEPVSRLHLSSGTSGDNKFIPFTASLAKEFAQGIIPWVADIARAYPIALAGRMHWVCSPPCAMPPQCDSVVPVRFDDDASYLPDAVRTLFAGREVVPPAVAAVQAQEQYYYLLASALLRARDLSFISIWSPSYLLRLLETVVCRRAQLLKELHEGCSISTAGQRFDFEADPDRARELERALADADLSLQNLNCSRVWKKLSLLSCWADGWSSLGAAELRTLFPDAVLQGKGLLATEGFITLPLHDAPGAIPVLSVCSHFFEFLDAERGEVFAAEELQEGAEYEVVITNSGGLYRYRLKDRVRCEGWYLKSPQLRFLGRTAVLSDLCGEKLSVAEAEHALQSVLPRYSLNPTAAFIAPVLENHSLGSAAYAVYLRIDPGGWFSQYSLEEVAAEIEGELCRNFYYHQCRLAAQLGMLQLRPLSEQQYARYQAAKSAQQRLGTLKWSPLECSSGWESFFSETA